MQNWKLVVARSVFLLLLVAGFGQTLAAQTLTVRQVKTGEPLEAVNVASAADVAWTNARGQVDIAAFRQKDTLQFYRIGYTRQTWVLDSLAAKDFVVELEQEGLFLTEAVISGTRWPLKESTVPGKITTISSEAIAFQNPQTMADVLGSSGDVFIQKSQLGGGSPMIRGFAANRVLLVVDGVRMNTAIFRSGNLQNVISLDPFTIDQTEVRFGPGSVLYGSDAIGGVMSFFTKSPQLHSSATSVSGNAVLRYASANFEKTSHVDLNIGGKKWAGFTSLTYSDFDDLRMGANGPEEYLRPTFVERRNAMDVVVDNDDPQVQVPTGYSQWNLMQKVRFRPNRQWNFDLGLHFSTTSDIPRYDRLIEWRNGQPRSAEWYYGPQDWGIVNLSATHQAAQGVCDEARLTLAYQYFQESRHDRRFQSLTLRDRSEQVDAYSANLDFYKELHAQHTLYYGIEFITNQVQSTAFSENIETGELAPVSTRYPDGSSWTTYAAYLSYRFRATDQLFAEAALRYSQVDLQATFDKTFFPFPFDDADLNTGALNGSLGFTYTPDEVTQFNLNLSTGFRAPNIDDVGKLFDSEPGNVIVPNANLQPEYAYSAEIGLERIFAKRIRFSATAFYALLDDALVRRNFRLNGQDSIVYDGAPSQVQAIQNAAQAYVWGIQAGMDVSLGSGLTFWSRFSYQEGEEQDDDSDDYVPLRHASPWFGTTHLVYKKKKWLMDLYAMYSGELPFEVMPPSERSKPHIYAIDANGNPYAPAWFTLNFKARYQLTDDWQLTVGVENMLDERYRPYSSGIVASGRNVILSGRWRF